MLSVNYSTKSRIAQKSRIEPEIIYHVSHVEGREKVKKT